eukprot:NODE_1904_length_477_cov_61.962617_g1826_i0.p1 GENE.NODE_1904_length_477_cov_61.962617_g1826_i0~~NODE_1904_length_477_cov_61.962617_g1826_i0.p1  ORF type:complete len:152 (-),score=46.99 NODE_1904_length_477_cov_61.962617_g1826_i0:21-455(-)
MGLSSDVQTKMLAEFGFDPLPASALAVANAAVDMITLKAGVTPWIMESSTTAGVGAGEHVFSVKRRSYEEFQLSMLETLVGELQDQLASLSATLNSKVAQLEARVEDGNGQCTCDDSGSQSSGSGSGAGGTAQVQITMYNGAPN